MHMHVFRDHIVTIHGSVVINVVVAVCWPLVLYLSKHSDIKGLELMSAFRGECKDEDVVIVCNCPELVGFMRVVAIKEEECYNPP
jgi:hypothetical protein